MSRPVAPITPAAAVGETSRVAPAWLPFAPYAVVSVLHVVLLALEHPLAGRNPVGDDGKIEAFAFAGRQGGGFRSAQDRIGHTAMFSR